MNPKEKPWLLVEGSGETGPFTYSQLQCRYEAREIDGDTLCYPKTFSLFGPSGWKPLKEYFPEFKSGERLIATGSTHANQAEAHRQSAASTPDKGAGQEADVTSVLEKLAANQEEQTRELRAIRRAILGIGLFFVIQYLLVKFRITGGL